MNTKFIFASRVLCPVVILLNAAVTLMAQPKAAPAPADESIFGSIWLYIGLVAIGGLIGLAIHLRKKEAAGTKPASAAKPADSLRLTYNEKPEAPAAEPVEKRSKASVVLERRAAAAAPAQADKGKGIESLPVATFTRLQRTNAYIQLPESTDAALLDAIDQTNEESVEDAAVRTQALKLLSTSKTSTAISAISQIALYDLSSKLRADAVGILGDMDHDSVFETVVTACADPTREVRAAAARALFKLSFDRGHAWARIVESGDVSRMRHAARCAIEGGLVERSLERLVHTDRKAAYEAFALTALLIHSGETEPIYKSIGTHKDENLKLALLHVLQTVRKDSTFDELSELLVKHNLSPNVAAKANEVRSSLQMAAA